MNIASHHTYARIERERRFLLDRFPERVDVVRVRRLTDRYLRGTRLRLRELVENGCSTTFKLTQKIPAPAAGAQQGFISSMYLTESEFIVLARIPADSLVKVRYSVPPFGIDVFEGALAGLVLAEAEFDSALAADRLALPSFLLSEVSADDRFTGSELARASRQDVETWLPDYGIRLGAS